MTREEARPLIAAVIAWARDGHSETLANASLDPDLLAAADECIDIFMWEDIWTPDGDR